MTPEPAPAFASLIEEIETGIVGLMAPMGSAGFGFGPIDVAALPETKDGIDAATVNPRIWVTYRESTVPGEAPIYGGLNEAIAQEETLHYDIVILSRGRKSDRGTYAVMEAARRCILGKEPAPGIKRLMFTGARLEEFEEKGCWRYSLSVSTTTILVAVGEDEEAGAGVNSLLLIWGAEQ